MPRPKIEIARAVERLASEPLVSVDVIADEVFAYPRTVARWITDGKAGIYLDGFHRPGVGWMTSRAAVKRFQDALLARSQKADAAELARLRKDGAR